MSVEKPRTGSAPSSELRKTTAESAIGQLSANRYWIGLSSGEQCADAFAGVNTADRLGYQSDATDSVVSLSKRFSAPAFTVKVTASGSIGESRCAGRSGEALLRRV